MEHETPIEPVIGAKRSVDRRIASLAEQQHGVVARWQLIRLGLGRRAIGHRLEQGRLHPLHRGVYAVGHVVLTREARWMAAVLASGPHAVLSHQSAAALWGMRASTRARVDVTVPQRVRLRSDIQAHQITLAADEVTIVRNVPVTTAPRTLLDLASVVSRSSVERAWEEAEVLRLVDELSLPDLVTRYPRRRGTRIVRAIFAARQVGANVTRSELEECFLAFLEMTGLPRPEVNVSLQVGGRWLEVDCLWRSAGVIVELDGHAIHGTQASFERDRARDRILATAGLTVVRITWRQLHDDPEALAKDLKTLLVGRLES